MGCLLNMSIKLLQNRPNSAFQLCEGPPNTFVVRWSSFSVRENGYVMCHLLNGIDVWQMFYKSCTVEYIPVGVVGTIVPWNYPFHNVFNPLLAAVFAGNACVIKVSEHASWSSQYYQAVIDAALEAAGAPPNLVQLITGVPL
jgi:hypothetical protein